MENILTSCYAAVVGDLTGWTYNNGTGGVAATLTAPAPGLFIADGVTPPVPSRILIWDEANPAWNGIYAIQVNSILNTAILTRTTDYNSVSQINPGDQIRVDKGNTLSGTIFTQTQTITAIGTSPIQFTPSTPISYPLPMTDGGTGSDLTPSNGSLVYSTATKLALLATSAFGLLVTDVSGLPSISNVLPSGLSITGLTAGEAVVTDGTNKLASLAYAISATASTLVQRNTFGDISAATLNGSALSIGAINTPNLAIFNNGSSNGSYIAFSANGKSTQIGTDGSAFANIQDGALILSTDSIHNLPIYLSPGQSTTWGLKVSTGKVVNTWNSVLDNGIGNMTVGGSLQSIKNIQDDGSGNATFTGRTFEFGSNTSGAPATMYLIGSSANSSDEGHLWFYKAGTTPTANGDSLGEIAIYGVNSGGTTQRAARIMAVSTAPATTNSVQTELDFRFTDPSGVEQIPFSLNYQGFTVNGCPTTFTGSNTVNFNFTGPTNVTFPTSGVLATVGGTVSSVVGTANRITIITTSGVSTVDIASTYVGQSSITTLGTVSTGTWNASLIPMAYGGTNANLTAAANNLVYSTASAMALLPTANNGVLITSNTGIPSISSTLPTTVQDNITQLGTITSGVWEGTLVAAGFGGTGIGVPSQSEILIGAGGGGAWTTLAAPVGDQVLTSSITGAVLWASSLPAVVQSNITITESQVTNLMSDLNSKLNLAGGTMTGNLILNADATAALQAVTYQQLQAVVAGLAIKQSCYAMTVTDLIAAGWVYANGSSGIGATLTAPSTGVFTTDGTTPAVSSRILVPNNTSATYTQGIYTVTTSSSGLAAVLTRATDFDTPAEIQPGNLIVVDNGTTGAGTGWLQTATVTAIGTGNPITFSPFNLMQAGTGLTRSGNTISLSSPVSSTNGGTGVNNGLFTITLGGNISTANSFTTSGNFPVTQTYTGITNVTFPTSGTLMTTTGVTINGTANQISVSGTSPTFTLSFPSVLQSTNNILDDGSGGCTFGASGGANFNFGNGASPSSMNIKGQFNWGNNDLAATTTFNVASSGSITVVKNINIGNNNASPSVTTVLGTINIETSGSNTTTIGNSSSTLAINAPTTFGNTVTLHANATAPLQAVPLQQMTTAANSSNFVAATFCGGF